MRFIEQAESAFARKLHTETIEHAQVQQQISCPKRRAPIPQNPQRAEQTARRQQFQPEKQIDEQPQNHDLANQERFHSPELPLLPISVVLQVRSVLAAANTEEGGGEPREQEV